MAGEAPTDFVLKAYLTEANARTDTTPLQVTTDTAYIINGEQLVNFNFFTHTKYWFRIESNEPVNEFYIDWDDGEDNDPKGKANYTTIKLDSPQFVGITTHIFTRDKIHYPKIRVKSVAGFWSKFYQASGDHTFTGIDVLQAEASNLLVAGRNDRYKIEADTTTPANSRIPAFAPTPKPPICILKSDKKRVYSGINSALLGSRKGVKEGQTVRLTGGSDKIEAIRTHTQFKVTYTTTGNDTGNAADYGDRGDITTAIMTFGGNSAVTGSVTTLSNVTDVLKVELVNQLEDSVSAGGSGPATTKLYPGEKVFLTVGANKPSAGNDFFVNGYPSTLAEVSLGNPIVELNDSRHTVTLDVTESYARTPEQTIDGYYIEDGKKQLQRGYSESLYFQELGTVNKYTDIFKKSTTSGAIDVNKTNSGLMKRNYTFDIHHDWCDDNHRWLTKQVLARGQVKASTPAAVASPASDSKATYTYSYLEHWQNDSHATNYNTDGAAATYGWPDDMKTSNLLCMVGDRDNDDWKDLSERNRIATGRVTKAPIFAIHDDDGISGDGSDGHAISDFLLGDAASLSAPENIGVVVAARDKKWTKQYWQRALDFSRPTKDTTFPMAPRVNPAGVPHGEADTTQLNYGGVGYTGYSYMNMRVQAFYTGLQGDGASSAVGGAGAMWKPLKLLNKTKHPDYDDTTWYTSGIFEWEEPEDWVSIDPADIPDIYWPSGDFEGDAAAFSRDTDVVATAAVAQIQRFYIGHHSTSYGSTNLVSGSHVEVSAFSTTSGTTDVSDGLSVIANNNGTTVVGKYFKFTECNNPSADQEWYVWFKQAATAQTVSFRVSNEGLNYGHWSQYVGQPLGAGYPYYGKWFKLTEVDGTTHGFHMNFGPVVSGTHTADYNQAATADLWNPWSTAGLLAYDGDPEPAIGTVPDNVYSCDCSAAYNSNSSNNSAGQANIVAIADAIVAAINAASGLGYAVKVTNPSGAPAGTYVTVKFTGNTGNATVTSGGGFITTPYFANHAQAASKNNQIYFTPFGYDSKYNAGSQDIPGKARGVNPYTKESSLVAQYGLVVTYTDGASSQSLATAVAAAINDGTRDGLSDASVDVTALVESNHYVQLTQDTAGAVADIADGTTSSSTDTLDLHTDFYQVDGNPDVQTNGADAILGGNFFDGKWDNTYTKYGLMFLVETDTDTNVDDATDSQYGKMTMLHTWPCSNNHSVLIDIVDPMCVSLSAYSIAQSISFTHQGKHQTVTDRLGKADIRKIGATGGAITFGGVDLKDAARKAFYDFQRKAIPVYIDVAHTNGEYSRFFGTIISMSESHPQGGMFPKFGLQMQVSHMIQFDASGNMLTNGYISLGGDMDEPSYI